MESNGFGGRRMTNLERKQERDKYKSRGWVSAVEQSWDGEQLETMDWFWFGTLETKRKGRDSWIKCLLGQKAEEQRRQLRNTRLAELYDEKEAV